MKRPKFSVKVLLDVKSPMADGVNLSNDIYLPDSTGPFPCLLIRTPYSNNDPAKKVKLARRIASEGYAVVVQDVRGRYDSEGEWEPFFNEEADGIATQHWVAGQPWCNGSIIQMGRSYEGYCTWVSAFNHAPELKGIIPIVALPDPVLNVPYQNGSVFWNMITWAMFIAGRTNQDVSQYNWERLYGFRPLDRIDEELGFVSKPWRDWMAHPHKDEYWKRACYMHKVHSLDIPALHICGWYDDDGISTYENFPMARKVSPASSQQYLLIGPWPHATNTKCIIPGVDFGPEEVIDLEGYILDWMDMVVGGRPGNWANPRARIFVMGENKWHDFTDWPPKNAVIESWFLRSKGKANSLLGDGRLSRQEFESLIQSSVDSYVYDPDNPTPYLYDAGTLQVGGPFDARPVQRRDDVLCYTSEPLDEPITICGRVFAELFVSSTAEDTEFCAKLCVVLRNGEARQLCDGNIRLAKRDSIEQPDPVKPNTVVKVKIDMWATGVRIDKGEALRLEVASAAVPKFAAHTNTLEPPGIATKVVIARNSVYCGPDTPSRILLPVLQPRG
ncbi:MAG: CocE/NonD family hydrolase [Planctomycetota bacterium]